MDSPQNQTSGELQNKMSLNKVTQNKRMIVQMKNTDTQLRKTLKTLAKADEVDLRLQQDKELQFRTKFEKYLSRGNFETSLKNKDGFKGAAKHTCTVKDTLVEYMPLHKLIYSNGEVDVDKVVCLHLLSVQLMSPASCAEKRNLLLFRKRSKPNMLESSALPFYILEVIHKVNTELHTGLIEGEDVIILVNTNLEKLIVSVLEVLAIVSPHKLQRIKEICHSRKLIQEIMIKPKLFNVLAQAKECPVLVDMENYRVEIARFLNEPGLDPNELTVTRIKVKDRSKKLELIQTEIKKMISLYTEEDDNSGESWSMFHKKFCSCRRASNSSITANAIALLNNDGTEFAVVTGTGCHLPKGSSVYCPSLTTIIKSRQEPQSYGVRKEGSGYSLHPRVQSLLRNEQNKLVSSLLHKVKNSQRILIGQTAAGLKTHTAVREKTDQKMPINKIMEMVFSKESLISFASTTENEELKLLFQPCCKGGLGIGSFILEPEKPKPDRPYFNFKSPWWDEDQDVPKMMQQEKSIMNTAFIKQEIFTSETRTKMKQFLKSDNPGQNTNSTNQ